MRITILCNGTRGDVQPFIAVGMGLQRAGHSVTLASNQRFHNLVTTYGLTFKPLHIDLMSVLDKQEMQAATHKSKNSTSYFRLLREYAALLSQSHEEVLDVCQNTDLILYNLSVPAGYDVAEYFNIPCGLLGAQPQVPTRAFPSVWLDPQIGKGRIYNLLTHKLNQQLIWACYRPSINRFRREQLGLPALPFSGPEQMQVAMQMPTIHGYSTHIAPRPDDWKPWHHIVGYWFLDAPQHWQPPADLVDFLAAGPPPVYVGFGSMVNGQNAQVVTDIVLKALARSGQRAVLAPGWGGLTADIPTSDDIFVLGDTPHSWLFPQMAAVIHHGGAGTTAAGLRAGLPSVIIPHIADQFFWGQRVAALGLGPDPLPRKQLTVERLAEAIQIATTDRNIRARAALMGYRLRAEDGVPNTVQIIERYVENWMPGRKQYNWAIA